VLLNGNQKLCQILGDWHSSIFQKCSTSVAQTPPWQRKTATVDTRIRGKLHVLTLITFRWTYLQNHLNWLKNDIKCIILNIIFSGWGQYFQPRLWEGQLLSAAITNKVFGRARALLPVFRREKCLDTEKTVSGTVLSDTKLCQTAGTRLAKLTLNDNTLSQLSKSSISLKTQHTKWSGYDRHTMTILVITTQTTLQTTGTLIITYDNNAVTKSSTSC